jgi:hypothetical protein
LIGRVLVPEQIGLTARTSRQPLSPIVRLMTMQKTDPGPNDAGDEEVEVFAHFELQRGQCTNRRPECGYHAARQVPSHSCRFLHP